MTDNITGKATKAITTLEDIDAKKAMIREEIRNDEIRMGQMWNSMFRSEVSNGKGSRIAGMLSTGAGILDGVILGWKLYRQFKKNPLFKRFG